MPLLTCFFRLGWLLLNRLRSLGSRATFPPSPILANKGKDNLQESGALRLVLGLTADNLDLINFNLLRIVELELDVFDDEGPHFVAEAVGVEMSLRRHVQQDEQVKVTTCRISIPTLKLILALTFSPRT